MTHKIDYDNFIQSLRYDMLRLPRTYHEEKLALRCSSFSELQVSFILKIERSHTGSYCIRNYKKKKKKNSACMTKSAGRRILREFVTHVVIEAFPKVIAPRLFSHIIHVVISHIRNAMEASVLFLDIPFFTRCLTTWRFSCIIVSYICKDLVRRLGLWGNPTRLSLLEECPIFGPSISVKSEPFGRP